MVKLYSTHCPKCKQIIKQLELNNIEYTEIDDIDYMKSIGLNGSMPKLETPDGQLLEFAPAWRWIKENGNTNSCDSCSL
jgi:hypothetical protein